MKRKKLAKICLSLGLFMNPFGFDAVQLGLIQLTGSYGRANFIMYCLAALFFGLYFYYLNRNQNLSTFFLTIAFFINPFGFDAVQLGFINMTGSYWMADFIMYCIAIVFFIGYLYFSRINPILLIVNSIVNIKNKISKIIFNFLS